MNPTGGYPWDTWQSVHPRTPGTQHLNLLLKLFALLVILEEEVELEGRAELLILLIAAQERRVGANLGTGGGEREGVAQD